MAEGNSAPGGDNRRLTFFDIFSEVTGMETVDLSGLLKKGSGNGEGSEGWLSLSNAMTESGKSSSDDSDNKKPDGGSTSSAAYTYTAYGAVWIGINADWELIRQWNDQIEEMDSMVGDLLGGRLGLVDITQFYDVQMVLDEYLAWLRSADAVLQTWVDKLTSDDDSFKGKAANVIYQHVKNFQFIVSDILEQIVEDRETPQKILELASALQSFIRMMATAWYTVRDALYDLPGKLVGNLVKNVALYVRQLGLAHGEPNYLLDLINYSHVSPWERDFKSGFSADPAKEYIRGVVAAWSSTHNQGARIANFKMNNGLDDYFRDIFSDVSSVEFDIVNEPYDPVPIAPVNGVETFPKITGPLNSAATWQQANRYINDYIEEIMDLLHESAREAMSYLEDSYLSAKPNLAALDDPQPLEGGGGGGGLGGGNGGGNTNVDDILKDLFGDGGGGKTKIDLSGLFGDGKGNSDLDDQLKKLFEGGPNGGGGPNGNGNGDLSDQLNNLLNGGGGPGGSGPNANGNGDLSDQLNNLLNGGGGPGGGGPSANGTGNLTDQLNNLFGNGDGPNANGTGNLTDQLNNLLGPGGLPITPGPGGIGTFKSPLDNNGKPTQLFDANGNPIPMNGDGTLNLPLDANGNPLPVFDANGNPVDLQRLSPPPMYDANGNLIPLDGDGTLNLPLDANGNPLAVFDANGNPALFDADGNPIPINGDGTLDLPLDANGNPLPVFDANGNPVALDLGGNGANGTGSSNIPDLSDLLDDDRSEFPVGGLDDETLKDLLNGGGNGSTNIPDLSGKHDPPSASTNIPDDLRDLLGGGNGKEVAAGANFPAGGGGAGGEGSVGGDTGGAGGFSGEGWSNWSGTEQSQGGTGTGIGGVGGRMPFMPPMMPPIMPPNGAQQNKDRERQTWLSEDEEIWGTKGAATAGVIGLPEGPEVENEEQRAPTHVHVRSKAPSSKGKDRQTQEQTAEQSSEGTR